LEERMKKISYLIILLLVLFGCGGGGGQNGSTLPPAIKKTVTVEVGRATEATLGNTTISFPEGSLPAGTTINLEQGQAPVLPQKKVQDIDGQLTINAPLSPESVTLSYPDTSNGKPVTVALFENGQLIGAVPATKESGKITVTLDGSAVTVDRGGRGLPSIISIVLEVATNYIPVDNEMQLIRVGSPSNGSKTLIFVHGLLQSANDNHATINSLKQQGGYGNAYTFAYDWRLPVPEAGAGLAEALSGLPEKSVDIVAYSKGGLVSRWALEKLGATKAVRRVIFLGTPSLGCNLPLQTLYSSLMIQFLTTGLGGFMLVGDQEDCLAELQPNSNSLQALNISFYEQLGNVDYYFFAGQTGLAGDRIVGINSALCNTGNVENQVNGAIFRYTLDGESHFTIDSPSGASRAFSLAGLPGSGITITPNSNPIEADPILGCWLTRYIIGNFTGRKIVKLSILFEEYDRFGNWQGNYWYRDPYLPGVFYPHERTEWEVTIHNEQSATTKLIQFWPNENRDLVWNAPESQKARTSHVVVTATDDQGGTHKAEYITRFVYNGITPAEPNTRSRDTSRSTTGGHPLPISNYGP
jgi:pimeloyl-ACP methyl ester carboxylesterase